MNVRWHPPLDSLFGASMELGLGSPKSVKLVLQELCEREPRFARYARHGAEDISPPELLVLRRGQVLRLGDLLDPEDQVDVLLLVTGG